MTLSLPSPSLPSSARAQLRQKRIFQGGSASALSRLLGIACAFVTLPIALAHLGKASFGAFLAISTLATLLLILNLGVADGMVTLVARAAAVDDHRRTQELISNAVYPLTAFVGALLVGLLLVAPRVDFASAVGVERSVAGANGAVLLAIVAALLNIPLTIAVSVRRGLQEAWVANLVNAAAGLVQLGGVGLAARFAPTLPWFVFAFVAATPLTNLVNASLLLFGSRRWLRPRWAQVRKAIALEVLRAGGLFALLGLVISAAFQTDALILAHVVGVRAVAEWGVASRVFLIIPTVIGFFVLPLWPAYGEAIATGDHQWVRRTFRGSLVGSLSAAALGAAVLAPLCRPLIRQFVGAAVVPSWPLIVAFVLYVLVMAVSAPLAMYMNGSHILRFQVVTSLAMAVTNVPLSIVLAGRYGVSGPVLGTVIAQTICTLLPCAFYLPRHVRRSQYEILQVRPCG